MNRTLKSVIATVGVLVPLSVVIVAGAADATVTHASRSSHKAPKSGHIGTTIAISGAAGSKANITLVKIIDPAQAAGQLISAPDGSRFVSTEFRLTGSGSNLFASADSVLSVTITGSNNQIYKSVKSAAYSSNITGCKNLSQEKAAISRGQSVTGCVNFTVPSGVTVSKVVYNEAGGTKGQWDAS
jgi:hypothetical protein